MAECIFCEQEVDEDALECPHCDKKPFTGMYFDASTFDKAKTLEDGGRPKQAWELLNEEYRQHTDVDYFDSKVAWKLHEHLEGLFERHPELIEERIKLILDEMSIEAYWGEYGPETPEKGIAIAQDADRPDLELMILVQHKGIQYHRGGPDNVSKELISRIEQVSFQINEQSV